MARPPRRRAYLVLALGAACVPLVLAGKNGPLQVSEPEPVATSTTAPTPSDTKPIRPAPLAADAATRQVLGRLGRLPLIKRVQTQERPAGTALAVQLTQDTDVVTSIWLSQVIAGAVGELIRTEETTMSAVITSATATGPGTPQGRFQADLGIAAVPVGQRFDSPSDAALRKYVAEVADRFDLRVVSLTILHPLESAVQVTFAVTGDAKPRWSIAELQRAVTATPPVVEGALIALDAPDGEPLLRTAVAYRTGGAGLWFAPGADRRFSATDPTSPVD